MPRNTQIVDRRTEYGNMFKPKSRFRNLSLWVVIHNAKLTDADIHAWYENGGACIQDVHHALALYRKFLDWRINVASGGTEWIGKLRGKNLACWCKKNEPCHADILLERANT